MTPLEIAMLIECYASGEPGTNILPNIWNSRAAGEARNLFISTGLVNAETLRTTADGDVFVKRLCALASMAMDDSLEAKPHR